MHHAGERRAASRLVDLVYAAVETPSAWQAVPGELVRVLDAEGAHLHHDPGAGPAIDAGTHADMLRDYVARFRAVDPFLEPALVAHMTHARRAFLSQDLIEDRELRASAYYNDFLRPHGNWFWAVGANCRLREGGLVQIWAWRNKALGGFDEHDLRAADEALRHALRAAELGARVARLSLRALHHDAVQDRLLDAVLVLDQSDRIVQRNARADALLGAAGSEAAFAPRLLRLANGGEQQRLLAAVVQARGGNAGPATLRLQRVAPLPPLYVVVASAPASCSPGSVQLFLRDPRWHRFLPEGDLCALYQLTGAQARVCAALVRGESLEDIAARLGVRLSTVRSQIKDAMEKIGLHRQSDLVRHLSMALPALCEPEPPN